jgi:hypothetical protein
MGPELQGLARALIFVGVILAGCGLVLLLAPKIPWIGRLPGDILIERNRFTFYFPLASCLAASLLLSLALWLFARRP